MIHFRQFNGEILYFKYVSAAETHVYYCYQYVEKPLLVDFWLPWVTEDVISQTKSYPDVHQS